MLCYAKLTSFLSLARFAVLTSCLCFRSFPLRGINHRSHHHRAADGLLPSPPLLPPPLLCPPVHHPYRWTPPHPDSQWRRPPHTVENRARYPPAEPQWGRSSCSQEDRWRAPPPPPLPLYSPHWTSESNGHDGPEEDWGGPKGRHQLRYSHQHRVNIHENHESDLH